MLEELNLNLFTLINATPDSSEDTIALAVFIAKRLILLFPIFVAACWLWGANSNMERQRIFVCKTAFALVFGLAISGFIGLIMPQNRPFVMGFGYNFLEHTPSPSFPSNHGTLIFTFAFASLFWLKRWIGLMLFIPAIMIAWSRIYLGVHWPFDMIGGFMLAIVACAIAQIIWLIIGSYLLPILTKMYRTLFSKLIHLGWIKE